MMKTILVHGLGQDEKSWNKVNQLLKDRNIEAKCPNLFTLSMEKELSYEILYQKFCEICNKEKEKLDLCGLSLGGILALDYAKEYPEKVNSLVLIGTPYNIPKMLFGLQNFLFRFFPKKTFEAMGISKRSFLSFVKSMKDLKISKNLEMISCNCLILCGEKDKANQKSMELFFKNIPNSKIQIISNASHEVNRDNPEELVNRLIDFWKK